MAPWLDFIQAIGSTALVLLTFALLAHAWRETQREQQRQDQLNRERHSWVLWLIARSRARLESRRTY